jgi:dTDP-glucose 4,6-dehydratase
MIENCMTSKPLPVYGKGENIRDWLYVDDHAKALIKIVFEGKNGETYCIGGNNEITNINLVHQICEIMNELYPHNEGLDYKELISFVIDRPGHDFRYAMDTSKIKNELSFEPEHSFREGLRKTVQWYVESLASPLKKTPNPHA